MITCIEPKKGFTVFFKESLTEQLAVSDGVVIYNDFMEPKIAIKKRAMGLHNPKLSFRLRLLPTLNTDENINITHDTNIADIIDQYINIVLFLTYFSS